MDRCPCNIEWKPLLGCQRNQLALLLIQGCLVADQREHYGAHDKLAAKDGKCVNLRASAMAALACANAWSE